MWRRTPAPKRGEILYAFGALMAEHKERLARAMTREMGKVIAEARGDVQEGIDIAFLMAGEGRRMHGDTVPSELPDKWAMCIRQPIGIAGIITPWNFPMAIPCWKIMPALVTGNTVVFKPASDTPHCATLLVELMAEAGVPPGVVNLVTGTGAEVGDAIVEFAGHRRDLVHRLVGDGQVDRRDAPGSGSSGSPWSWAARTAWSSWPMPTSISPPTGSCGARSARPVSAARQRRGSSSSARSSSRCCNASRRALEALRLGDGLDAGDRRRAAHQRAARSTRSRRTSTSVARRVSWSPAGPRASDGDLAHGNFFEPTIFAGVGPMDRIGQEEIFGPVLSIIPVDDYGEAMLALNQTRYGLSSSIFTQRREHGIPGDARLRDRHRVRQRRHDRRRGRICRSAAGRRPATATARPGNVALDTYTEWKSIYVDFSGRLQRAQIDNQTAG